MNLLNFISAYPDEASCKAKFKAYRDKEGVTCKKCGHTEHYWLSTIEQYKCKKCGFRTSIKSGTVLENSKLPYRYWFVAMHLITSTKKTFSALELQRQLGHNRYEPIWAMLHKLRIVMGKRDDMYFLDKQVEIDEGFFEISLDDKDEGLKRGRGSQRQAKVLVMTSEEPIKKKEQKPNKKTSKLRFIKMKVLDALDSKTIQAQIKEQVHKSSTVKTDGYKSYSNLKNYVRKHLSQVVPPEEASIILPWVHTMIANAKRTLLGIHHMMTLDYIQNYLNEFCYKVNRRYFGENIFDRLLIASVSNTWTD
jgi:transposase-like protein